MQRMQCLVRLFLTGMFLLSCQDLHAQRRELIQQSIFGAGDSTAAMDKLALAKRMTDQSEWIKAAEIYHEVLKGFADRVWPQQRDSDGEVIHYTSMTEQVQQRLAGWPANGLEAYRTRYEPEAAALLEAAGDDPARLNRIYADHFVTDSARNAALKLMDLYFERGEFSAAAWIGGRLLDWHPGLGDLHPAILYRTALALRLGGDEEAALKRLGELREKFPRATASIRGAEIVLSESLGQELGNVAASLQVTHADAWPMAFGGAQRSRAPRVRNFGGARLFSIELPRPSLRSTNSPESRRQYDTQNANDIGTGLMTGILPVVDRGEMFFQDNVRIYAVSVESGLPLPGWAATYPGEGNGRFVLPNANSVASLPRSQQCTIAVTDDSVLAMMGQIDLVAMNFSSSFGVRDTRLVCLDRKSGRLKWSIGPKQFPEEAANLRNLDLSGSPLVVGDTVYIQARGGKGLQFEDSYVVAFNLADGALRWVCYVASANSGVNALMAGNAFHHQEVSHLAYSGGRIYAQTNVGVVAAVDAYDGTVIWLNLYPRDYRVTDPYTGVGRGRGGLLGRRQNNFNIASTVKPWTSNPVILSQGKVFVLPSDGLNVHVYDAGTGAEIKRIPTRPFDISDAMLGVVDEKLILHSDRQVHCINWRDYDIGRRIEDNLIWRTSPLQRAGGPSDSIRGRGFVTSDSVIIPTEWQLYSINLASGKIMQTYPAGEAGKWAEDEGPGNVILTQDRLIIAGPSSTRTIRVNVYTDVALAVAKLDAEVAAAPSDPAPLLRYAEVMLAAGKFDAALEKLDQAISLIGGNSAIRSGATRDRIFNTALNFAQKMSRESTPQSQEMAAGLFDRAGATAATPAQKVNYRLVRAGFEREKRRFDQELRIYHQLLADPELRNVMVASAGGETSSVVQFAGEQIGNTIRRAGLAGTELTEASERAANEMFTTALRTMNPEQLQLVAHMYPKAMGVSPRALIAAADFYENAGNSRAAVDVLRQAMFKYQSAPEASIMLEAMARNYARLPEGAEIAHARLIHLSKLPGAAARRTSRPIVLPDGRRLENLSYADAANAILQSIREPAERPLPDARLPASPPGRPLIRAFLPETPESIINGVTRLLVPEPEFASHDRIVTFTPAVGIRVYPVGGTQPIFTSDAITQFSSLGQLPPGAAWIGPNLMVWSESEIAYLSSTGNRIWKVALAALPALEIVSQPGADAEPSQPGNVEVREGASIVIEGRRIIVGPAAGGQPIIIRGGQVFIGGVVQPPSGQSNRPRPAVEQISQIRALRDRIVVGTTEGRIITLDLPGGKMLWQSRINEGGNVQFVASNDFVVVRNIDDSGLTARLAVFDAASGWLVMPVGQFGSMFTSTAQVPVNMALSPDGMLALLLPDQIRVKDLFQPGGLEAYSPITGFPESNLPFQASDKPDHLQLAHGRIFVVGMESSGWSFARMYDLRSGTPINFGESRVLHRVEPLASRSFAMQIVGSKVFIITSKEMRGFDLKNNLQWDSTYLDQQQVTVRQMIVARNHVVAVTDRLNRPILADLPSLQIKAISRATTEGGSESGRLDQNVPINNPATILNWQVVNGGIYYLAGDSRLHFLRGAGE